MTIALDIDLRKIYAVDSGGDILAKAEPNVANVLRALRAADAGTILIEVASPLLYMNDNITWKEAKGQVINRIRWAIWNLASAHTIDHAMSIEGCRVLVAPSHVWTKGHDLKMRHEVAGCKHKQKDLRECEAMIFYHHHSPESWIPMAQYLEQL